MERVSLLGVPVDSITANDAVARLRAMLVEDAFHPVATPNNEMLVTASRNARFRTVLQQTALNLPDSTGVVWAARLHGHALPGRVTGVDTVTRLCEQLDASSPVFLLGAWPGVAEKAAETLKSMNPALVIAGAFAGSPVKEDADDIIKHIAESGAKLLLVAYGAPAQDLWIAEHRAALAQAGVRVAIGVGGTFDFLAGTRRRAPRMLRKLGLEWLWRLLQEPSRIGRIWTAVVVFPWLIVTSADAAPPSTTRTTSSRPS